MEDGKDTRYIMESYLKAQSQIKALKQSLQDLRDESLKEHSELESQLLESRKEVADLKENVIESLHS